MFLIYNKYQQESNFKKGNVQTAKLRSLQGIVILSGNAFRFDSHAR